ncbi:hypothetical protein AX16_001499 [Volvariella volvacea WC 439]|nr:hypothetical protein AX16_001499 [Volvariella volvacea WC 439]
MSSDKIPRDGWSEGLYQQILESLAAIERIEAAGGSKGFIEALSKRSSILEDVVKADAPHFSQSVPFQAKLRAQLLDFNVEISTEDGHSATWHKAPWLSPVDKDVTGTFYFNDWDTLMSAANTFYFDPSKDVVPLRIDDEVVGQFAIKHSTSPMEGFPPGFVLEGSFNWKAI